MIKIHGTQNSKTQLTKFGEMIYLPGLGPKGPSLGQVPAQKKKKSVDCELRQQSKFGE